MATDQFTATKQGQKQHKKFLKALPKVYQRVAAATLTSMARADREQIPKTMDNLMTVRTPSIIKKATRFEMANKNDPVSKQEAKSGSIKTDRHDAWFNIQEGKSTRITQFTDAGRIGGQQSGKAKTTAKAGRNQLDEADFTLKSGGEKKAQQYLQAIKTDKTKRRKTFYIKQRLKRMERGIYKFVGGAVRKGKLMGAKIKRLSTPKAKVDVKRINWMQRNTKAAVTPAKVDRWWISNMKRELNRIKPK